MLTSDQERMLKILNDTVAYYGSDPSRRAVSYSGRCQYRTPEGNKCAFGRYIRDDVYEPWMECGIVGVLLLALKERGLTLNDILVEEAQGLSESFWFRLQLLHDNPKYWSDTGLLAAGATYILSIQDKILTGEW